VAERWRDVAHIGHAELLTPTPEASLEYFTALLGLTVAAEGGGSWYLRIRPDGHPVRIYYETSKYAPPTGQRPAMKSNHQQGHEVIYVRD
jgi:catechol 2,3-dioxygenase-like lactoylglutathione lyase family enzyme